MQLFYRAREIPNLVTLVMFTACKLQKARSKSKRDLTSKEAGAWFVNQNNSVFYKDGAASKCVSRWAN